MQDGHLNLAQALTSAMLASEWTESAVFDACVRVLGRKWRWLRPMVGRTVRSFPEYSPPTYHELLGFLSEDSGLERNYERNLVAIDKAMVPGGAFQAHFATRHWKLLRINTIGELAEWLGVQHRELDWFADLKNLNTRSGESPLSHYRFRVLAKRFGKVRMIESPKRRLKEIQGQILWQLLSEIPVSPNAHGFRRGHSIRTFAEPHVGKNVVLRIDLENFFPRVQFVRILSLFQTAGYPKAVALRLAALCTHSTPHWAWGNSLVQSTKSRRSAIENMYARRHLPQGAPSSPALANLIAWRMDCRLSAYAETCGANYTRYADDLVFSGGREFSRSVHRFQIRAAAIAMEEGFGVNHYKTRIMRSAGRQCIAGIVVNRHPNIPRCEYDRLKAILTNCIRHGPATQNRECHPDFRSHLAGKISHVQMINPRRARHLLNLFKQIEW